MDLRIPTSRLLTMPSPLKSPSGSLLMYRERNRLASRLLVMPSLLMSVSQTLP